MKKGNKMGKIYRHVVHSKGNIHGQMSSHTPKKEIQGKH